MAEANHGRYTEIKNKVFEGYHTYIRQKLIYVNYIIHIFTHLHTSIYLKRILGGESIKLRWI